VRLVGNCQQFIYDKETQFIEFHILTSYSEPWCGLCNTRDCSKSATSLEEVKKTIFSLQYVYKMAVVHVNNRGNVRIT
jgi:hypothetical protein